MRDGAVQFRVKYDMRATFSARMKLIWFPFDVQHLQIKLSSVIPSKNLLFKKWGPDNTDGPPAQMSLAYATLRKSGFGEGNVFAHSDRVFVQFSDTDAEASTTKTKRPLVIIGVRIRRHASFFIYNVFLPQQFITGTSLLHWCLPFGHDSTADKIANSLTILLTAVAFKLMVSGQLPDVSYLTTADHYLLQSFTFIALVTVEGAMAPYIGEYFDMICWLVFCTLFVLHTLSWIIIMICYSKDSIRRLHIASFEKPQKTSNCPSCFCCRRYQRASV